MKMMLGLTPITDGNITMFGMQFPANKAEILRRVGVMIETPGFYPNLTATENLQILSSLRVLIDFLFVWQLTMLNCLKLHLPICIAYRITYPLSIVEYTPNLQYGLDALYYPAFRGELLLVIVVCISMLGGMG